MKKMTYPRWSFVLVVLILSSCQESGLIAPREEIVADNLKDIEFAQDNLKLYAQSVLAMQNESGFRADLYAAVEEAFDGEKNVLFKTLMDDSKNPKNARSLKDNLQQLSSTALTAFNNIEGYNYYPQVYIPFYEELKTAGKLGKSEPKVIVYTHNLPNSEYPTYTLNSDGSLTEGQSVSEDFAKENEVWVVSISERVDDNGAVKEEIDSDNGRTQGVSFPNARFQTMKITSHKEEWVAGGSEVSIKRYMSFFWFDQHSSNPVAKEYSIEDAPDDGSGKRVKDVKRSDVDNTLTINWTYVVNWPNQSYQFDFGSVHTDFFYYVVFEYDAWPTGLRNAYIPDAGVSGNTIYTCYRSADTYYKMSNIPESGADGWSSTSGFHFTSQY